MRYLQAAEQQLADNTAPVGAVDRGIGRRDFVKVSVGAGLALGWFPLAAQEGKKPDAAALKPFQQPAAFVAIDTDGRITVQGNRLDMGQGSDTGLAMALAEELDADWSKVRVVPAPLGSAFVDPTMGMMMTGGSTAIANSYAQYRELGARMRAMLVSAAAQQWGVPGESCTVAAGVVACGTRKAGFGELAARAMTQPVPQVVRLKDPKDFRIIGRPTTRLGAEQMSRGEKRFAMDMDVPGVKTVLLARPPVFGGKVRSMDAAGASAVRGVESVFVVRDLDRGAQAVAVVANGFWPARQAREALKVDWDLSGLEKTDSARLMASYLELARAPGVKASPRSHGDLTGALASASRRIVAEFSFPFLAHAAMEPLNCTIDFDGKRCRLWYGAQMHNVDAQAVARVLGIDAGAVEIVSTPSGGGFGRRAVPSSDFVAEAAQVAKAWRATGKSGPLRIVWTREDDMKGGYYRPLTVHRAEVALDAAGKVTAWKHTIVSQSILAGSPFEAFMVKDGVDATTVEGVSDTPYSVPLALEVHHPKTNVPVLWWRSVGHTHTAYAMETLVDEVARATQRDPVELRREWLGGAHPRHRAALDLAVARSGYGKRSLPAGRAWGVALHESFETVVAYVTEVSLQGGAPVVHRITAGVHCNLPVNPRSIEAQIQGSAIFALSTTLPGATITLREGVVQQANFNDYTVARMGDAPPVDVHIVPSADPPKGIGEPGVPPLAPAIANAIGKLIGRTPRSLPFERPLQA
jgi:isoquinoline 1-oxidoreductase beta subunit